MECPVREVSSRRKAAVEARQPKSSDGSQADTEKRSTRPQSVLRTIRMGPRARQSRKASRMRSNSSFGNRPNTKDPSPASSGRRSGPGHRNKLNSLTTTQQGSRCKPSRARVAVGISTPAPSTSGLFEVIGSTATSSVPSSRRMSITTAQGLSFAPSSWPRSCSWLQR
jgi:hypothetical protein